MLDIRNATRIFGRKAAVDHVSFRIDVPAFVGIIGRFVAGKSTLLRMMNGLAPATSGQIIVEGRDVAAPQWQSQCAMILQQYNLVPRMDVVSNVLHGILNQRGTLQTVLNLWPRADIVHALEIWTASALPNRRRNGPRPCRAACSSAWPSPAPCPMTSSRP